MGAARCLPGGGPWRILDKCPAPIHNSVEAARGRNTAYRSGGMRNGRPKCVCPGAMIKLEADRERRRVSVKATRALVAKGLEAPLPVQERGKDVAITPKLPMPDLSRGVCRTNAGRRISDLVLDGDGGVGAKAKREHKIMCSGCPVQSICAEYVLAAEPRPGVWAGVWGGMSQTDRKEIRQR